MKNGTSEAIAVNLEEILRQDTHINAAARVALTKRIDHAYRSSWNAEVERWWNSLRAALPATTQ